MAQFDSKQVKNNHKPGAITRSRALKAQRLQRYPAGEVQSGFAPPVVYEVLKSQGLPLDGQTQQRLESRFNHNFSRVRVHTDQKASASAQAVSAQAYTVGEHIVFNRERYAPHTPSGRMLIAHELAHVVQQGSAPVPARLPIDPGNSPAEQQAVNAMYANNPRVGSAAPAVQRQGTGVTVRSPVVEETVTQASDVAGGLVGRSLSPSERDLARPIFGTSLDYDRIRLISSDTLSFRTVGNNIYVPDNFSIRNASMAQTLIHEMTHAWQFQHSGTSYISVSLGDQLVAAVGRGSRNFAYAYTIQPNQTFFDFNPEQQGSIVEHYFAMLRDQREIPIHQAANQERTYESNHLGANGFPRRLSATQRLAEISSELPQHQRLIRQMQAALPRSEVNLLQVRTMDLMQTPGQNILSVPEDRQLMPVRPLLEVRFPGL